MKQLEDLVIEELNEMDTRPHLELEMPRLLAYMLISQCQLAFRHPANSGPSRREVEKLVEELRGQICEPGSAIDITISMGYEADHDTRQTYADRLDPPN